MMAGIVERWFVDTNVLVAATDTSRGSHPAAFALWEYAGRSGILLALSGQVLRKYAVVATRPVAANGLGLAVDDAMANMEAFHLRAEFLPETEKAWTLWQELVLRHGTAGKRLHDVNIVATLLSAGIRCLVTDSVSDFEAFADSECLTPAQVVERLARTISDS